MAQQGKGKGFAVVLSMVAIAGVVGYLIYRRFKNKPKTDSTTDTGFMPTTTGGGSYTPTPTSSGGSSSGGTSSGNPFATKEDLIKFQQWVINTKGDKTILGKGGSTGFGDDGVWGSKSQQAYNKYGTEYKPSASTGWDGRGSIKSTESGVNVWKDLKFTKPYGSTAGSQLSKSVSGKYIFNPIPSGAYMGEATGVIVADSSGVQYREVVAPSDRQDLFKDSNNNIVTKAYVNRNKTTKY